MNYISLNLLILFFLGIILLFIPSKVELKDRIQSLFGTDNANEKETTFSRKAKIVRAKYYKRKYEADLAECLAYIKNNVVLGRGNSISSEVLLSELAEFSKYLDKVFLKMAGYMHVNDKSAAAKCLGNVVGGKYAEDIGRFLAGWDDIPPSELLGTVTAYQDTLRSAMATEQKKRDEVISDLIYLPVVIECMGILLNFVYVGLFLQQREALAILF